MTMGMTATANHAARTWREPLGRAGLAAKGVLYFVLGLLAIQFATGDVSSEQVSQQGAIETVADQPFGKFLLVALVLGLIALMIWHAIQAFTGDPVEGSETSDRLKYAVKAVLYGALVVAALRIVADTWSGDGASTSQGGTDNAQNQNVAWTLFDLPGGRLAVGLLGVVIVGVAGQQVYQHTINKQFMQRLTPPPAASRAVEVAGRLGYLARAVVFAVIGVFFVVAAVEHDPTQSKGISGSIQELTEHSWGSAVLWGVAIGLVLFGLFCLAEAKYRRAA